MKIVTHEDSLTEMVATSIRGKSLLDVLIEEGELELNIQNHRGNGGGARGGSLMKEFKGLIRRGLNDGELFKHGVNVEWLHAGQGSSAKIEVSEEVRQRFAELKKMRSATVVTTEEKTVLQKMGLRKDQRPAAYKFKESKSNLPEPAFTVNTRVPGILNVVGEVDSFLRSQDNLKSLEDYLMSNDVKDAYKLKALKSNLSLKDRVRILDASAPSELKRLSRKLETLSELIAGAKENYKNAHFWQKGKYETLITEYMKESERIFEEIGRITEPAENIADLVESIGDKKEVSVYIVESNKGAYICSPHTEGVIGTLLTLELKPNGYNPSIDRSTNSVLYAIPDHMDLDKLEASLSDRLDNLGPRVHLDFKIVRKKYEN